MANTASVNVTAGDTWTDELAVADQSQAWFRVSVVGTTYKGEQIHLRVRDPALPGAYSYRLIGQGTVDLPPFVEVLVSGPAFVAAGVLADGFVDDDDFTILLRCGPTE